MSVIRTLEGSPGTRDGGSNAARKTPTKIKDRANCPAIAVVVDPPGTVPSEADRPGPGQRANYGRKI